VTGRPTAPETAVNAFAIGFLALALLVAPEWSLRAQQSVDSSLSACPPVRSKSGFTVGASVDQFGFVGVEEARATTLSLHLSGFKHDGLGNEVTLGMAVGVGGRFVLGDFSLMQGIPLVGTSTLLVRGGVSLALGGGILPGANFGLGVVIPVMPQLGVRLDAMYRPFLYEMARLDSYSVGIGLMSLP
jgi:hypothetical protein